MEIKTKFDVDQYVFILFKNKIYEVQIESISIHVCQNGFYVDVASIQYMIGSNPAGTQYTKRFDECEMFETKEALAQSLIDNSKYI